MECDNFIFLERSLEKDAAVLTESARYLASTGNSYQVRLVTSHFHCLEFFAFVFALSDTHIPGRYRSVSEYFGEERLVRGEQESAIVQARAASKDEWLGAFDR